MLPCNVSVTKDINLSSYIVTFHGNMFLVEKKQHMFLCDIDSIFVNWICNKQTDM